MRGRLPGRGGPLLRETSRARGCLTKAIVEWAARHPFAWVAGHHPGPALLLTVDHATGLTGQDLAAIADRRRTVA
ncbi:hypothetical protein [Amycolatopsis sp. NPDC003861]